MSKKWAWWQSALAALGAIELLVCVLEWPGRIRAAMEGWRMLGLSDTALWIVTVTCPVLLLTPWVFHWLAQRRDRLARKAERERRERLTALALRITKVTSQAATFRGPMATTGMIRGLHPELAALGILCPPPPQDSSPSQADDWIWFLHELHPLLEADNVEPARTLWADLKRRRGY